MDAARRVAKRFGGQTALANALGTHQSTVSYWVKQGRIPAKWHQEILDAAAEHQISLGPGDLVSAAPVHPDDRPEVLPRSGWRGDLRFGDDLVVRAHVLDTGQRVITRTDAVRALAGAKSTNQLEKVIKPLGPRWRHRLEDELLEFSQPEVDATGTRTKGLSAEAFLDICKAFVESRDNGELATDNEFAIAKSASAFISACATIGLIALIDEATGYQYERATDALQVKLSAFLEEEMREWEKTFPDDLWLEFGRLTNWDEPLRNRPKYWGKLVNELVYELLDPDVAEWLKTNAPAPRRGQNYHQWLSSQYGLKKLLEHIWVLIGVASTCTNLSDLRYHMNQRFGRQPLQLVVFTDQRYQGDLSE